MIKINTDDGKQTRLFFKIPENKKLIVFLSGSQVEHGLITREEKISANKSILATLSTLNNQTNVIIKLHPVEQNFFPVTWKENMIFFHADYKIYLTSYSS
jgi:hypothetical protein